LAQAVAQPPPEAVLQEAHYEQQADQTFFLARWLHYEKDILVEKDYIQVLINGNTKKAFSCHRSWHRVMLEFMER
jgi:hypothetical protein